MAIYLITGKLGAGKTLAAVGRIRDALREGRIVATNLDLNLDKFLKPDARAVQVYRVPDKPSVADFVSLGLGNASMDESKNGLIVLDELGSWLNARAWADKTRQSVIDWLIHSRKHGWDVMFICQDITQVDRQVRDSLVEYLVRVKRLDRLKVPLFGALVSFLTAGIIKGRMPQVHVGRVTYGTEHSAPVAERWWYLGRDLYAGYNTRQVFSAAYDAGLFSYLTPWHLVGRFRVRFIERVRRWFTGWESQQRRQAAYKRSPAPRLAPLLGLAPDVRWRAAQALVRRGKL